MSDIDCYGTTTYYGQIVPGWHLVWLNKTSTEPYIVGKFEMKNGDLGLTWSNDPDFVFSLPPFPFNEKSDEELDAMSDEETEAYFNVFTPTLEHYIERLTGYADVCWRLVDACITVGYNPKTDGFVAGWLSDRMYNHLQNNEGENLDD